MSCLHVQPSQLSPLGVALLAEDEAQCQALLSGQQAANGFVYGHWRGLHLAAAAQSVWACERLLKAGADPNVSQPAPRTPLMLAAELGYTQIVDMLIEYGACVDEQAQDSHTALSLASGSNVGYLTALLTHGANVNQLDAWGRVPLTRTLLWAPHHLGDLLQHRADPNTQLPDGHTPLTLAIDYSIDMAAVALLRSGGNPHTHTAKGHPILWVAAQNGLISTCETLVHMGVDVQQTSVDGNTAVCVAVGPAKVFLHDYDQAWQRRKALSEQARKSREMMGPPQKDDMEQGIVF